MRANTIWGFIGLAITLFIWWTQVLGTPFGYKWGELMWVGIVISIIGIAIAVFWPRIVKTQNLERESHELGLYNADPAIKAFTERRANDLKAGIEPRDHQLGGLVLQLVTGTVWGRWQAEMHNVPYPVMPPLTPQNRTFIRMAESHLLRQLEQGLLAARGLYKGNSNDIRFISPNWWGLVYIEVVNDDRQIFKATIRPRDGVDPEVCKRFTGISIELPKFFAMFPKEEEAAKPAPEPQSFEPDS
jgi:hypothetical protein